MVVLSLIGKSLLRERALFGLWIASLCVAVSGLLIVDVFRNSLTYTLQVQGQNILTADISISSRRALTDAEKLELHKALPLNSRFSTLTEMFGMVSRAEGKTPPTRLASLRFIDDNYPLIGELMIERQGHVIPSGGKSLSVEPLLWVAPDLLTLLKVHVGDSLKVGEVVFKIDGVIAKDPSQTFRFGNMAPRIFLNRRFLGPTALVQIGSTFSEDLFAAIPQAQTGLKRRIEKVFTDSSVQITVPDDLEQGSFRVLSRLLDFLGLTGLVTLCLGWIGVYYLGRRWLSLEAGSAGVLKCLGFSNSDLQSYLLLKLSLIMVAGILSGGFLAWLGAHGVFPLVKDSLPAGFILTWSWTSTFLLLLVGPLAGLLLMLPSLRAVGREPPLVLIQGTSAFQTNFRDFAAFSSTAAALFFALTLAQARSWRVTFVFLGALLATVFVTAASGYFLVGYSRRFQFAPRSWRVHLALSQWSRRRALAVLLITVSAMSGLLSQLIPNLEKTLVGELQAPLAVDRPALFLFDIQDEQVAPLTEFLREKNLPVSETAPFIRARILKVNGVDFERSHTGRWNTREEELDSRSRNRGINLSYRDELSPSESILEGKPWNQLSQTIENAEVSVEEGYADRLKLKVGDQLQFDVQGLPITAKIANLRQINWDSFQPNFFIMFRSGVLNDAPKTWIMTVNRDNKVNPGEMQSLISGRFPNVTSINVQEALDNAADLFAKLAAGLRLASGLCMALGLFVFLMILLFQLASSQKDWMQLYVLGLNSRDILSVQIVTYGGLCLLGVSMGSVMSLAVAAALAHFAFDSRLSVDWPEMAKIFALSLLCAGLGMILLSVRSRGKTSMGQLISD